MNAVLQSLRYIAGVAHLSPADTRLARNSNIQQFSEYFKELPSLEKTASAGKTLVTATAAAAKREAGEDDKT